MSDPVTNVEIEDVLSSIRRLVSENARSERPAEPAETAQRAEAEAEDVSVAAQAAPTYSGMLVLTPDHRVRGSDETRVTAAPFEATPDARIYGDGGETAPEETHHWGDDDAESELEEAAELAGLEAAIEDAVHEAVETAVQDELADALGASDAEDTDADWGVDGAASAEPETAVQFTHRDPGAGAEMATLADRIAGLEAAVAEREDQWEPDGEGEDDNAGGPVEALNWEDEAPDDGGHVHVWEADPLEPDELSEPEPAANADAAAPETEDVSEETVATPEVEAAEPLDVADTQPEPEDAVAVPPLFRDAEPVVLADAESVIDEDMLREMVAEIVRRELQGTLGERITRNVRKLVRREIHRALAARQLD